jgi:hypothetical protein
MSRCIERLYSEWQYTEASSVEELGTEPHHCAPVAPSGAVDIRDVDGASCDCVAHMGRVKASTGPTIYIYSALVQRSCDGVARVVCVVVGASDAGDGAAVADEELFFSRVNELSATVHTVYS